MDTRPGAALLSLLLVLAGCVAPLGFDGTSTDGTARPASPTATPPGTPTPTTSTEYPDPDPAGKVAVHGESLSFAPALVYRRVLEMHDVAYEDAPSVDVYVEPGPDEELSSQLWETTAFMELWGIDRSGASSTTPAGLARGDDVYLYVEVVTDPAVREAVLAHEFAHVVQHASDAFRRVSAGVRGGGGDAGMVYTAVVEGTASAVEARYAERYLDLAVPTTWEAASADRSRFGVWAIAPYYFGRRYVDGRVDAPGEFGDVYDDPPVTTEQVIHGYEPDEELPRRLSVAGLAGEAPWSVTDRRVKGELFVRVALGGELSRERAAGAAGGWGADRMLAFEADDGGAVGHAWVLRWDTDADADEFAAAMVAYLDGRGERTDVGWRDGDDAFDVERVGDDTVVVLLGDPGFVADAEASGSDGDVTVAVEA